MRHMERCYLCIKKWLTKTQSHIDNVSYNVYLISYKCWYLYCKSYSTNSIYVAAKHTKEIIYAIVRAPIPEYRSWFSVTVQNPYCSWHNKRSAKFVHLGHSSIVTSSVYANIRKTVYIISCPINSSHILKPGTQWR